MTKFYNYNLKVGNKVFENGTHIMAILNLTPDSFYPLSRVKDDLLFRAENMIKNGAEILDIGGQSTRPNAVQVGVLEEISRVVTALETIKKNFDVPVSIDTFYPEVAEECLKIGAEMINDVSCLAYDNMAETIAKYGASICIMHDRRKSTFPDMMTDKIYGLSKAIDKCLSVGIDKNKILLDGGIGFNKGKEEDFELLKNYRSLIDEFPQYPFLLGTSRKSMFGGEVFDRLPQTLESTIKAVRDGVLFVRVHDIKENMMAINGAK